MRIEPVSLLKKSKLLEDYEHENKHLMTFFDYKPSELDKRMKELNERSFQRQSLSDVLRKMNEQWDAPKAALENIEALKDEQALVVVAGQQAGLLMGPLYTLNKIISLVHYAKKQQEKLKIPIIPLFWIAGEDHDFAEINHVYLPENNRMKKITISQYPQERMPVSNIEIDQTKTKQWIEKLFLHLRETEHTKDIYYAVLQCLKQSKTYVDFFARLVYKLFPEEGIVLMDSNHAELRKLETDYFKILIENQEKIAKNVHQTAQLLKQAGYPVTLDVTLEDGNLFYHRNNERLLLMREAADRWTNKQGDLSLTTKELLEVAKKDPSSLSNNVTTRPLMQEMLFPTLAFIGGPGEMSYWALLKRAFNALDLKMPPIIPRRSFTYVDRPIERLLDFYNISVLKALEGELERSKINWLASHEEPPVDQMIHQIKQSLRHIHEPLQQVAYKIRKDVGELADKNLYHLETHIDYLEHRIKQALHEKYSTGVEDFDLIRLHLQPKNGLQERCWNILPFLNIYGLSFGQQVMNKPHSFEHLHYIVYL